MKQCDLKNGAFALLPLGAGLVMASSADVRPALMMGGTVLAVLLLSTLVLTVMGKLLPKKGWVPAYLLVVTGFVSLAQMLLQAYFPNVVNMVGVHLAALAVSAVPFRKSKEWKAGLGKAMGIAAFDGLCFALVLVACGAIREVLGSASFFGMPIPFLADYRVPTLAGVLGGYLVLAFVLAAVSAIANRCDAKQHKEEQA